VGREDLADPTSLNSCEFSYPDASQGRADATGTHAASILLRMPASAHCSLLHLIAVLVTLCVVHSASPRAAAQPGAANAQPSEPTVQLNFPNEIEIQGLVDYVGERAGVRILYDEQIAQKSWRINKAAAGAGASVGGEDG